PDVEGTSHANAPLPSSAMVPTISPSTRTSPAPVGIVACSAATAPTRAWFDVYAVSASTLTSVLVFAVVTVSVPDPASPRDVPSLATGSAVNVRVPASNVVGASVTTAAPSAINTSSRCVPATVKRTREPSGKSPDATVAVSAADSPYVTVTLGAST